jgi:hypothetical protein
MEFYPYKKMFEQGLSFRRAHLTKLSLESRRNFPSDFPYNVVTNIFSKNY